MVSEAEQVLTEVLSSASELNELLAFSAQQQEVVCLIDLVCVNICFYCIYYARCCNPFS